MLKLLLVSIWLSIIVIAISGISQYDNNPAQMKAFPRAGPRLAEHGPTLTVFLHPKCPCSRATVSQIVSLLNKIPSLEATVYLVIPPGGAAEFASFELVQPIEENKRVHIVVDRNCIHANRYRATTSGESYFFAHGKLYFHGGLTPGRGHEGRCAAIDEIVRLATVGTTTGVTTGPVFGCSLQ